MYFAVSLDITLRRRTLQTSCLEVTKTLSFICFCKYCTLIPRFDRLYNYTMYLCLRQAFCWGKLSLKTSLYFVWFYCSVHEQIRHNCACYFRGEVKTILSVYSVLFDTLNTSRTLNTNRQKRGILK